MESYPIANEITKEEYKNIKPNNILKNIKIINNDQESKLIKRLIINIFIFIICIIVFFIIIFPFCIYTINNNNKTKIFN